MTKKIDYTLGLSERLGSDSTRKIIEERINQGLEDFLLRSRDSQDVREASRRMLK